MGRCPGQTIWRSLQPPSVQERCARPNGVAVVEVRSTLLAKCFEALDESLADAVLWDARQEVHVRYPRTPRNVRFTLRAYSPQGNPSGRSSKSSGRRTQGL